MGKRKSVYQVRREAAESPPSPNGVVPQITVEIKAFWPAHMNHEERVAALVRQLAHEVVLELGQVICACGDDDHEAYL